jgi:hypothetical protein
MASPIRVWWWSFTHHHRPAGPVCGHCGKTLVTCPACLGAWRPSGCVCGIGSTCPICERFWA